MRRDGEPVRDDDDDRVARSILALTAARGPDRSICPSEAARDAAAPGRDWRALMPAARRAATRLTQDGSIRALQRGRAVDPATARGPIRLAALPDRPDGRSA